MSGRNTPWSIVNGTEYSDCTCIVHIKPISAPLPSVGFIHCIVLQRLNAHPVLYESRNENRFESSSAYLYTLTVSSPTGH